MSDAVHLAVLVPVFSAHMEPRPLGVLVLRVDPEIYLYPYLAEWPASSDTAETLIVRREGDEVVFLNSTRFRPNAALNLRISLENTDVLAVKAALGQTGLVEGVDYRGEPVLGSVEAVPGSPWYLVARMDTQEVFAPLRERLWETLVFFGALVVAGATGLGLAWRQQRMRFYRSRELASEALHESEDKFKYVFDNSVIGKSITLPSGEINVNQAFCEMLGYSQRGTRELEVAGDHSSRRSGIDPAHGRCAPFRRKRFCALHQEVYPQERLGCVG